MDCDPTQQIAQTTRAGTDMFTSRSNDIFAGLGELEKKHSAFLKVLSSKGSIEDQGLTKLDPDEENNEEDNRPNHSKACTQLGDTKGTDYTAQSSKHNRSVGKRHSNNRNLLTQNSKFKRPQRRPVHKHGKQGVPDFRKHPEKYMHYSLGDVSEKEMSERSNSQAAFAFLEERRSQREKEEKALAGILDEEDDMFDTQSAACSQGQIAFSRPHQKRNTDCEHLGKKLQTLSSAKSSLFSNFDDEEDKEETLELESTGIKNLSDSSTQELQNTKTNFKSRKTVSSKRNHIRRKTTSNDDDSD